MPASSKGRKAERKHNVTTDFPQLGLHSAAATGNVGLVNYALSHGQPINSVLDGLLPLHAACSGGNSTVVRILIAAGADVNAPRLPRRYSNTTNSNNNTASSAAGPSSSGADNTNGQDAGSTPLHFAAANGHTQVVLLLLRHGARPDRPDKYGVTPEALARQEGWLACADALRDWVAHRDADLRERDEVGYGRQGVDESEDTTHRRRLAVKRSLDTVVRRLRSSSSLVPADDLLQQQLASDLTSIHTPPDSPRHRSRRPSAEREKRLGAGKYSLLNLFRKASADALVLASSSSGESTPPLSSADKPGILRPGHGRSNSSSAPTKLRFGRLGDGREGQEGEEDEDEDEEEEEEYGRPLPRQTRARGPSLTSQPERPNATPTSTTDFPFSIERPPTPDHSRGGGSNFRPRGDSQSTASSSLFLLRTPDAPLPPLPHHADEDYDDADEIPFSSSPSLAQKLTQAQAQALVLRTQASVLELDGEAVSTTTPGPKNKNADNKVVVEDEGAELSARLAAYGESLALARRLRDASSGTGVGLGARSKPRPRADTLDSAAHAHAGRNKAPVDAARPRADTVGSLSAGGYEPPAFGLKARGFVGDGASTGASWSRSADVSTSGEGTTTTGRSPRTSPTASPRGARSGRGRRPRTAESAGSFESSASPSMFLRSGSGGMHSRSRSAAPLSVGAGTGVEEGGKGERVVESPLLIADADAVPDDRDLAQSTPTDEDDEDETGAPVVLLTRPDTPPHPDDGVKCDEYGNTPRLGGAYEDTPRLESGAYDYGYPFVDVQRLDSGYGVHRLDSAYGVGAFPHRFSIDGYHRTTSSTETNAALRLSSSPDPSSDPDPDLALSRIVTAPGAYGSATTRRTNKLARMGFTPAREDGVAGMGMGGGREREGKKWGFGRLVAGLKGRG